jgi:hypothetical protein
MSGFLDWVRRVVLGQSDERTLALQLLDAKEAAALADIRALRLRADEQIEGLARQSTL